MIFGDILLYFWGIFWGYYSNCGIGILVVVDGCCILSNGDICNCFIIKLPQFISPIFPPIYFTLIFLLLSTDLI